MPKVLSPIHFDTSEWIVSVDALMEQYGDWDGYKECMAWYLIGQSSRVATRFPAGCVLSLRRTAKYGETLLAQFIPHRVLYDNKKHTKVDRLLFPAAMAEPILRFLNLWDSLNRNGEPKYFEWASRVGRAYLGKVIVP